MAPMKRIGDVTKAPIVPGPYGEEHNVYSLAKTDELLNVDMTVNGYQMLEGENGSYVHILVTPPNGVGPGGETNDIVVSTGARAIKERLSQLKDEDFPVLARFVKGKGRGSNVWYDME